MTSDKPISRQALQQKRLKEEGRCVTCWKPKGGNVTVHCPSCRKKSAERSRQRQGFGKWKRGGRGRPPVKRDEATGNQINVVAEKMSKIDYSLTNKEICKLAKVSDPTVRKYRKIYGANVVRRENWTRKEIDQIPNKRRRYKTYVPFIDWSATNYEISCATKIPYHTVINYRKKYAPQTLSNRAR